jgi:hypothetical protein
LVVVLPAEVVALPKAQRNAEGVAA